MGASRETVVRPKPSGEVVRATGETARWRAPQGGVRGTNIQPSWRTSGLWPPGVLCLCGGEQFPVPLGDDFDSAVNDFEGGLVVDRIRWTSDTGCPLLCLGYGVARHALGVHVRTDREVDDP